MSVHLFEGHARLFGVGNDIEVFACHDKVRDGIVHDGQDMRMVLLSHLPAYHSPPAKMLMMRGCGSAQESRQHSRTYARAGAEFRR